MTSEIKPEDVKLPEPAGVIIVGTQALRAFTADQVRAAVLEAKAQERERWAKLCDSYGEAIEDVIDKFQRGKSVAAWELAAAIRAGHSVTETKRD